MYRSRYIEVHVEDASLVGEVEAHADGSLLSDHLLMLFNQPVKVLIFKHGVCKRLIRPKEGAFAEPLSGWYNGTTTAIFEKPYSLQGDKLMKHREDGSNGGTIASANLSVAPADRPVSVNQSTDNPPPQIPFFNFAPTPKPPADDRKRKSSLLDGITITTFEKLPSLLNNTFVNDHDEGSNTVTTAPVTCPVATHGRRPKSVNQSTENPLPQTTFANVVPTQQSHSNDDSLKRKGTASDGTVNVPVKKALLSSVGSTFAYRDFFQGRKSRVVPVVPKIPSIASTPHENTFTPCQPGKQTTFSAWLFRNPRGGNSAPPTAANDESKLEPEVSRSSENASDVLSKNLPTTNDETTSNVDDDETQRVIVQLVNEIVAKVIEGESLVPSLPASTVEETVVTPSVDVLPVGDTQGSSDVTKPGDEDRPGTEKQQSADLKRVSKTTVAPFTVVVDTSKPQVPSAADQTRVSLTASSVANMVSSTDPSMKHESTMAALVAYPPTCQVPAYGGVSTLQLVNPGGSRLAFKIKSSNIEDYRFTPIFGFVAPGASTALNVARLPGAPKKDRITVQFVEVAVDVTDAQVPFKAGPVSNKIVIPLSAI